MEKKHSATKEAWKIIGMAAVIALPVVFLCLYIRFFPMNYGDDELPYYLWNKEVTQQEDTRYYSTLILGDCFTFPWLSAGCVVDFRLVEWIDMPVADSIVKAGKQLLFVHLFCHGGYLPFCGD